MGSHYESSGGVITKYYLAGGTRVAMRTGSASFYWLLSDHLGSTSKVATAAGALHSQQLYKAWGESRYASGTLPTRYTYTGQYSYASDFGLVFYGSRFYDPLLSRWAQPDSIIPQNQGTQAWDRYSYVNNSPLNYTDPTGHMVSCGDGDAGACGGETAESRYWQERQYWLTKPKPDAYVAGVSGNVDAGPAVLGGSVVGGAEVVYNTNSNELSLFIYGGAGGSIGTGANSSLYGGYVNHLPENIQYSGPFMSADLTISVGPLGFSTGKFFVPGDNPINPQKTNGGFVGFAPGANVSSTINVTNFAPPLLTINFDDQKITSPFISMFADFKHNIAKRGR